MRRILELFAIGAGLVLVTGAAFGQATPEKMSFEVASVKPAAPLDMAKLAATVQQGGEMPKLGARIDGARAEYTYMAIKELIATAYKVKPYQITGPDWIGTQRFDIVAKMPEGASKDDAPKMLQTLLEDRLKLAVHRESKEHPVLALLVGKGGPKMKASEETPQPIDPTVPLKPGESQLDTPEGPIRMSVDMKNGAFTMNMGAKGIVHYSVDRATMMMHLEASMVTMEGFADMLTQFSVMAGGGSGPTVKDLTELKGNYQVAMEFSLADMMNMARAQGMDVPALPASPTAAPGVAASDPSGGASLTGAVQAMGLKLEQRKAMVEQLVVDHVEKTPTEN
jgi:uncharacterized protein (TIGR03435 family)